LPLAGSTIGVALRPSTRSPFFAFAHGEEARAGQRDVEIVARRRDRALRVVRGRVVDLRAGAERTDELLRCDAAVLRRIGLETVDVAFGLRLHLEQRALESRGVDVRKVVRDRVHR
jgi:hypothetical protein